MPAGPRLVRERAPIASSNCVVCGFEPLDLESRCPTCDTQRMPPNVVLASRLAEQDALVARVESLLAGRPAASVASLLAFGEAVRRSVAVVNVSARYALDFLESNTLLYATYARLVESGARRPASGVDDTRRRSVESMLFGSYAEEMRYAALSLGGLGLVSYGPITMVLRDLAVAQRASLLEENSFQFVEKHMLRPGLSFPIGYRCPWPTRHYMAMAKCGAKIDGRTTGADHRELLLRQGSGRSTDDFIEVYIFGPFGRGAVERIVLPMQVPKGVARSELRMLRAKAKLRGVPVEDA